MTARQNELGAKVERVSAQVCQLTVTFVNTSATQSNNIEYLLNKTVQLEQGQQDLGKEMNEKFDAMDKKFDVVNEKLDSFNQRFDQLFDFLRDKLR